MCLNLAKKDYETLSIFFFGLGTSVLGGIITTYIVNDLTKVQFQVWGIIAILPIALGAFFHWKSRK